MYGSDCSLGSGLQLKHLSGMNAALDSPINIATCITTGTVIQATSFSFSVNPKLSSESNSRSSPSLISTKGRAAWSYRLGCSSNKSFHCIDSRKSSHTVISVRNTINASCQSIRAVSVCFSLVEASMRETFPWRLRGGSSFARFFTLGKSSKVLLPINQDRHFVWSSNYLNPI